MNTEMTAIGSTLVIFLLVSIYFVGLLLFGSPRAVYALFLGYSLCVYSSLVPNHIGFYQMLTLKVIILLLAILGLIMDNKKGQYIICDFIKKVRKNIRLPLPFLELTIIYVCVLAISKLLSENTFFLLLGLVFPLVFLFVFPRTAIALIINWLIMKDPIATMTFFGWHPLFFVLYAISLILVFASGALDFPQAREVLRLFTKPDSDYGPEEAIYLKRARRLELTIKRR